MHVSFIFALVSEAPSLSPVQVILQIVAVALVSFVVLALTLSILRYQNMVKEAAARLEDRADREAVLLFLSELPHSPPYGLIRLLPEDPKHVKTLQKDLKALIRETDRLIHTDRDELLMVFPATPEQYLPRILARTASAIESLCSNGRISYADSGEIEGSKLQAASQLLEDLRTEPSPGEPTWNFPACPEPFTPEVVPGQEHLLDEVTGVLKPGMMGTAIQKVLATYRRRELPAGILLFGVDDLENYTQSHGSDAVNAVLHEAGALLMRSCRESDFIAREGEETLVICMPGKPETLLRVAKRICAEARAASVVLDAETLRFTFSAGLSAYPSQGSGPHRLLGQAHTALEAARKRGRGSCLLFEETMVAHQISFGALDDAPESF